MNRIPAGPHHTKDNPCLPDQTEKTQAPAETENDWNNENSAFVAAYNELIDAEGVALAEYRLF